MPPLPRVILFTSPPKVRRDVFLHGEALDSIGKQREKAYATEQGNKLFWIVQTIRCVGRTSVHYELSVYVFHNQSISGRSSHSSGITLGISIASNSSSSLKGFIEAHRVVLEVEVSRRQGQQLSLPDSAPVQHLEGVVRYGLVHNRHCEFLILLLRPELHFLAFLAPNVSDFGRRIAFQPVVLHCMVQDGEGVAVCCL